MNFFKKKTVNSITPEQNKKTEVVYSNIFETILADKEPYSYQTGLKHTLLTKRGTSSFFCGIFRRNVQ